MQTSKVIKNEKIVEWCLGKTDELNTIPGFKLIPSVDCASTNMVTELYKTSQSKLRDTLAKYRSEFERDGVTTWKFHDFDALLSADVVAGKKFKGSGMYHYTFINGLDLDVYSSRITLFPKKAILRAGLLLKGSEIASELREKLMKQCPEELLHSEAMNTERKAPEKRTRSRKTTAPTFSSEEEKSYCLKVAKAFSTGDITNLLVAAMSLDSYRKRTITELQNENKELSEKYEQEKENNLSWADRSSALRLVKFLSGILSCKESEVWEMVYQKLTYTYGIPLVERAGQGLRLREYIQSLDGQEWHLFYRVASDICDEKCIDMSKVMSRAGVNASGLYDRLSDIERRV